MSKNNLQTSKQKSIEFHSELKSLFLKLHTIPLIEDDFIVMAQLLEISGVNKSELNVFFTETGNFDFKKYLEFINLSQNTIISVYTDISKLD